MSIHELIYELCQGFRLPNPPDCPAHISQLLEHCFYEEPNRRPTFTKIKSDLQAAYDDLMALGGPNSNISGDEPQHGYATLHGYATILSAKQDTDDTL